MRPWYRWSGGAALGTSRTCTATTRHPGFLCPSLRRCRDKRSSPSGCLREHPGAPAGSRWEKIAYPYTDEDWGKESRDDALWPCKFWKYPEPLPPTTGTMAAYVTDYLCKSIPGLPLVEEGVAVECPHCGKTHTTYILEGKEGEKL